MLANPLELLKNKFRQLEMKEPMHHSKEGNSIKIQMYGVSALHSLQWSKDFDYIASIPDSGSKSKKKIELSNVSSIISCQS